MKRRRGGGRPPPPAPAEATLAAAEAALGHRFADRALLIQALSHAGLSQGRDSGLASNERLEFVGDRVLGLIVAEWLIARFPEEREGALGRRLGHLVAEPSLAEVAVRIGLGPLLAVAPSDDRAGVRERRAVLADAVEAVIGALYLDGGLDAARGFIHRAFEGTVAAAAGEAPRDPKSALQEWTMARGLGLPEYRVIATTGPAHAPSFRVQVECAGRVAEAEAGVKQSAEKAAAAALLAALENGT
ncbi:ribonuclease III [Elioraea sp.]|uniref:ribonuclease III n=1 Tax=Elioraea sp. TaxID=2185103 RepID=UPI0025C389B2|nr:ribonuclease III [Elioraea sp.]